MTSWKINTKHITNVKYMFARFGFNKLTTFIMSNDFNTINVENMVGFFYACGYNKLAKFILTENFKTYNVTTIHNLFSRTAELGTVTEINLGNYFYTYNCVNMNYAFNALGMNSLKYLRLGEHFVTDKVENLECAFQSIGINTLLELDLGNFGVNRKNAVPKNTFYNCGSSSTKVIVKNADVQTWVKNINNNAKWADSKVVIK